MSLNYNILLKLSIIIPCLNESKKLSELLPYLQAHTNNKTTEIIVVDAAGSIDDSLMICQAHNSNYLKAKKNQRAGQMNAGALQARGNILCFLHADVIPPTDFEKQILTTIHSGHDFGLFAYRFDKNKWYLNANAYFTQFKGFFCGGGDQCHFIPADVFHQLSGYNDQFSIMEDYEFYRRIRKQKANIKIVKSKAIVSARKYDKYSYFRINLVNLIALILFKLNFAPDRIKVFCKHWLC